MDSRFSRPALAVFEAAFGPWRAARLIGPLLSGVPRSLRGNRPLLLASNHVSWWDAFTLRELHRALRPDAPLYTVMLESELRRFPFFRWLGAVGVEPGRPSSLLRCVRFLTARAAERRDLVVLFFPQGRIWPSHRRPLGFEGGAALLARTLGAVVLPVAQHVEPLSRVRPTAMISVGEPLEAEEVEGELEGRVEEEADRILAFLARHGEAAARVWPRAGERLPDATLAPRTEPAR